MFTLEESVIIIFASLVGLCFLVLVIFFIIHKLFKKSSPKKKKNRRCSEKLRKIYSSNQSSTLNIQKYYFESDAIQLKNVESYKVKHNFNQRPNYQDDGLFKSSLYSSRMNNPIIEPSGLVLSPKTCPPARRAVKDINQCNNLARFYGSALVDDHQHEESYSPSGFPRRSRSCTRSQMRSHCSTRSSQNNQMATISRSHRHQRPPPPPHDHRLIINNSLRSYGSVVDVLEGLAIQKTPNIVPTTSTIFDPKSKRSPDHHHDHEWHQNISDDHSNNESLSSASRLYTNHHHMDMIRNYPMSEENVVNDHEMKSHRPPPTSLRSPHIISNLMAKDGGNDDHLMMGGGSSQISDLITADEFLSTISDKNNKPFEPTNSTSNVFQRNYHHPMQYRSFNIKTSNTNIMRQKNSNSTIVTKNPRENNFYRGKNSNISKVSTFQSSTTGNNNTNSKTSLRPSVSVRSLTTTVSICEDAPYFWDDFDLRNVQDYFTENTKDNTLSQENVKDEVFVQNVEVNIPNENEPALAENDDDDFDEDDFIETLPENDEKFSSSNLHTICEIEDDILL